MVGSPHKVALREGLRLESAAKRHPLFFANGGEDTHFGWKKANNTLPAVQIIRILLRR